MIITIIIIYYPNKILEKGNPFHEIYKYKV